MTTWKADLERALTPASARDIRIEVAKNFTVMASRSPAGEDDIRGQQMLFVEVLDDLPLFAIRQACLDYRKGIVGDGKWAPTPAEVRSRAQAILGPTRADIYDLDAIIGATPLQVAPPMLGAADRLRAVVRRTARESAAFPKPKEVRDLRTEPARQRGSDERLRELRYLDRPLAASPELRQSKLFTAETVTQ